MKMIGGPAGGMIETRMLGTKVQMAGRSMFLPKTDVPIVQQLTLDQIKAIPKDRFAVAVIEPTIPLMSGAGVKKGRGGMPSIRRMQRPYMGGMKHALGYINKMPSDMRESETSGTKTFNAIVTRLKEDIEGLENVQQDIRVVLRKQNPQPKYDIFFEIINEDDLADCIRDIIKRYFGTHETCKIIGAEYKLAEFCVLMHFYFIHIGILENQARQPFSNYLQKKVFDGVEKFTAKTFNNYGNAYDNVKKNFIGPDKLKFDFERRPDPSGKPVLNAFHEIGFAFHNSKYFRQLRKLRESMNNLLI